MPISPDAGRGRPRIGLALSGGAARAAAHIGVLEVLETGGVGIGALSGTSGGALIAALYASGRFGAAQLIEEVERTRWRHVVRPAWPVRGLFDSGAIGRFIEQKLGPLSFSDLRIPLAVLCTNLRTGRKVVLTEGPLAPAVQASCSLPVFFTPTTVNGMSLVDGGYVSQIPIRAAREVLGAETVIGVDVNFRAEEDLGTPTNVFSIAAQLAALWARRNAEEEAPLSDAMIRVDARGIGLTDLNKAGELIERGRAAAKEFLDFSPRFRP